MDVKLIAWTNTADELWEELNARSYEDVDTDLIAEYAGRICYRSVRGANPATATNDGYLANIIAQGHFSVLEHASASFLVTGVSRHLLGELSRHRFLSFSVESLRYCPPLATVVHPTLAEHGYSDAVQQHFAACMEMYDQVYEDLRSKGLKKKEAAEAAAQFLPLSTSTDLVVSGNFRAWRDTLGKRLDTAANREIRQLANLILDELKGLAPNSFQDFEDGEWSV